MAEKPFAKILIANRGEIAIRVIRACHEMGIEAVAVFSDADEKALHVQLADEAVNIGPAPSTQSYLKIDTIIDAARRHGAEAIHPGYGFLSERAEFSEACRQAKIAFIGPPPEAMRAMGDKLTARRIAVENKVPLVPGSTGAAADAEEAAGIAGKIGYPVILKASAGGGGKGMRLVREKSEIAANFKMAGSEAASAFGDPTIYIEKYIENPRHIEMQILADSHGNIIHLGERECSIQRRHQKLIEETPSPAIDEELRTTLGEYAVKIAAGCGYVNAGTVEFMLDTDGRYYFLEMNTRLQVEHPITELVTGIDLVQEQIRIAAGEKLAFRQSDIEHRGSAIEVRVYAEDPENDFAPSPGRISHLLLPGGPGVRIDSGIYAGYEVPLEYDPLLAKVCVWGADRAQAMGRMLRVLREMRIGGITTSIAYAENIIRHPDFAAGNYNTHFIRDKLEELAGSREFDEAIVAALGTELYNEELTKCRKNSSSAGSMWKYLGRLSGLGKRD